MELSIEGAIDVASREEYCSVAEAADLADELTMLRRKAAAWDDRERWLRLAIERFRGLYVWERYTSPEAHERAVADTLRVSEGAEEGPRHAD